MKIFHTITEVLGWLRIVASPFLAALVIGGIIYLANRNTLGVVIAIVIASTGLVVGVVWATKIRRTSGTVNFLSRIIGTPELDNKEAKQE